MGGCCTSKVTEISPADEEIVNDEELSDNRIAGDCICPEFAISDFTETKKFRSEIVSGDESSDGVYKAEIKNFGFVSVKKLNVRDWPYQVQFAMEAHRIYELRHTRFAKFLGYCCDEEKKTRLLVAEFLPYDNLAKRLFHEKSKTMEWGMRLRVAYCVAEAVDFCSNASATYNNLSPYTILFDKDGDACLSCFGLMKEIEGDRRRTAGSVNSASVIYRFGSVLVNLLTGKQIPPSHAPELINGKNVIELMDPNLEGKFSDEEATVVFEIASKCLHYEETESINTKDIVATLKALQKRTEVPSYEVTKQQEEETSSSQQGQLEPLQTKSEEEASSSIQLSPLGEACMKRDLNAIYEILVKEKYVYECSLKEMLPVRVDVEAAGKLADYAFEKKDFESATQSYNTVIRAINVAPPSAYARCCLSSIFCKKTKEALADANQAIHAYPDWPIGYYLRSVISAQAGQTTESAGFFKEATLLEQKRHGTIC